MHPRSRQALPHLYYPPGMYQVRINPRRSAASSSTLLDDLANWWDLLGNANDSVGGANLTTSESFSGTAPSGDTNCIVFDGTGGAEVGSAAVAGVSRSAITIGLWWRRDTATDTRALWYYGAENTFTFVSNRVTQRVGAVNNNGPASLAADTWYCSVFSATGSTWEHYINNASYDSGTEVFDFTPASEIFDLGNRAGTDLHGKMCCCALWDRVLTADERTEFYNSGVNLKFADL